MADAWIIEESQFSPATGRAYEGLFTLGSGYMHVRGSLAEGLADSPQNDTYLRMPANVTAEKFKAASAKWGTYVPGIFGRHPTLNNEMVNLPFFLDLRPLIGGEKLDMAASRISGYSRWLDMREATLSRSLLWHTAAGVEIKVTSEEFVSAAKTNLCVQRLVLAGPAGTKVTIRGGINSDIRTSGYDHLTEAAFAKAGDNGVECRVKTDGGDTVRMISQLIAAGAVWQYSAAARSAELVAELEIPAAGELVIEKRTAVATGRDLQPRDPAETLRAVAMESFSQLHQPHAAVWAKRWDASDVIIEGDDRSQMAMRAAVYHLLRVHVPGDCRVAVDAKGYAGDAYFGRFFWDTEMYLLPFYLYTNPADARTLVDFRVQGLDGARANARRYGYRGARYAWESDPAGNECCPNWQYCDHEIHVTAAVVYGLVHYARAVCDEGYLTGHAAETLAETARYWLDRIDRRAGDENYSLLGVMGPDEYTPISSNNSYTNRMAAFSLATAARYARSGGANEQECAAFADAAARLPILRRDDGLVLQCEEFEKLAEPRFEELWKDRSKPFAAQVSQERLYRTKCLKQADVLMLMMLFPDEFADKDVRKAWDYYLPVTTHDSSLSAGAHAIIAKRLRMDDKAWEFWQKASGMDLDVSHGGAADGVHIAGAGATWQVAVLGFAGMATAMQSEILKLSPRLPKAWTRLAFPVVWRGCPVYVDINSEKVTVANRGEMEIVAEVYGEARRIPAGRTERFLCGRSGA